MTAGFFIVAILGCADGSASACADARVLPARYETVTQCRAALPQRLAENTDLSFPELQAICRAQGPLVADTTPRRRG